MRSGDKQRAASATRSQRRPSHRRSAVVILELILTLPVLVIFLLAVVEFGLILALSKQVSYASKYAAKIAAEQPRSNTGLGDVNLNSGGSELLTAVNQYLSTAGFSVGACRVILRHDVASVNNTTQIDGPGGCAKCVTPPGSLPVAPAVPCPNTTLESVRVTVCVPVKGNIPNLLCTFGFDNEDCVLQETTTYRFEDCP